ncbi:3-methyl-2-oxobutanoate hydroxymethyltransferase [Desulfotalea psychrophila]|uniref:3-methyl-2-oxobutanoate hydroxymethyltransferase n=1 Tax=Desulfotalea psychrophila (strain LSv54 / DSM 12343) TaxID=177439 RepID=PANB_DESPS|nr:3-methyl-2-oxobutanoate hydroxymethyltransferase [Desulfotalea psychrophila]Q6AJ44.2 RecName: Full=3-methyl-2-oxobutanoate hydroxymethyltransferase; AltName: Full=Ketopantoate hydroxymethyltransferase; Short=KPHMT [Desulfotalea psychrophila LSv54]
MRKTVVDIIAMKAAGQKISMLTAYDASMSALLDQAGIDILLVGDSLGMTVLGYDSTVPVTMADMVHHMAAVRRGAPDAFVVGDMPFGSYQTGARDAVLNAMRLLKEGGCDVVKLEGGEVVCPVVKAIVDAGIPVMGHLGLTPQTAAVLGGYKVQGRDMEAARKLFADAKRLEEAGVCGLVLECIPAGLAEVVTASIAVPTVGIGAGKGCDGQVLVINDMLGLFEKFTPKFVKHYAQLAPLVRQGVENYIGEVRAGAFPEAEHTFTSSCDYKVLLSGDDQ